MKSKRIIKKALILIVPTLLLTSCVTLGDILAQSSAPLPPSASEVEGEEGTNPYPLNGTYGTNDYEHPITANPDTLDNYYKVDSLESNPNLINNTAISHTKGMSHFDSIGNQKLMVVPVKFTDTPNSYGNEASIQGALNRAFFGESTDTGWESVASFYRKSSYGRLNIEGEVMPIFDMGYSTTELTNKKVDNYEYWDQTHYVIEQVYNTYASATLKDYDQNNDGYVDAVFFVYLAPVDYDSDDSPFWAFQYFWNRHPDKNKPVFNTYAWASYEFMVEGNGYTYLKPAAHTYIHESGHLFSFDDYYDYDNTIAPAGTIDMMDHNIIDHNMFSKFVANWSTPFVPVGNSDIHLRPAESSGDFIIINDGWNGHAYDEYILIEYYTPTGLNEHDSTSFSGYNGSKGYSIAGVRIWHVDARLLLFSNKGNTKKWTDSIPSELDGSTNSWIDFATSNTPSYNKAHQSLRRLHLLDSRGREQTWGNDLVRADNRALFQKGAKIESTNWKKYLQKRNSFNDGSEIGYSIEIGEMDATGVTIKIRKD